MQFRRFRLSLLTAVLASAVALPSWAGEPELGSFGVDLDGRDLDRTAGDDFFRHANGQWLDDFEIPADLSVYGSFTELFLRSEEQVQAIIEEAAAQGAPEGTNARKIGDLYASFLDTAKLDELGLKPLEREFERIYRANSPAAIATLMAATRSGAGRRSSTTGSTRTRRIRRSTARSSTSPASAFRTGTTSWTRTTRASRPHATSTVPTSRRC